MEKTGSASKANKASGELLGRRARTQSGCPAKKEKWDRPGVTEKTGLEFAG
jgi:hypothetical protein